MNYCILAPPKITTSAGIVALYLLNGHLIATGQVSRIITLDHTGTVIPEGVIPPNPGEITIIPETFPGNIFQAKNVVRYLLMFAGYFGHTKTFPESEYLYYYTPEFIVDGREPENILSVPVVNELRFPYQPDNRHGTCYLAHKYKMFGGIPDNLPEDCEEITKVIDIEELFKTKKKLISYDNSAINLEAAMCGMEVEFRFNEHFERPFTFGEYFDNNQVRESYNALKTRYFKEQLPAFITKTQERFK